MIETRIVQKFGNSGHIVLPKEYVGKRIKFIAKTKIFSQIKSEIMNILEPNLEHVLGVYLYGSYAREEETLESDIDILVVTDKKIKIKHEDYQIASVTEDQIEEALKEDAVLILPIIKESKPIINPQLLEKYKLFKFTKENTKEFLEACERMISINKKYLELDLGINSTIYSLILRIRGLLIISLSLRNKIYTKSELFSFLKKNFAEKKIYEFYDIYSKVRNKETNIKINMIEKRDVENLLITVEKLLNLIKGYEWERKNTRKE